jgi:hypothetical protein
MGTTWPTREKHIVARRYDGNHQRKLVQIGVTACSAAKFSMSISFERFKKADDFVVWSVNFQCGICHCKVRIED